MPPYTLAQAADATRRSRSTILRAIQTGKISARRDELTQGWLVEPAELHRVYPVASEEDDQPRTNYESDAATQIVVLRERLAHKQEMLAHKDELISDLRHRLGAEEEKLRKEMEERRKGSEELRKLTALLTDQRSAPAAKKRRWWRFGRAGA